MWKQKFRIATAVAALISLLTMFGILANIEAAWAQDLLKVIAGGCIGFLFRDAPGNPPEQP